MAKKTKKSKSPKKQAKIPKKSDSSVDDRNVYSDSRQSFTAATFLPRHSRY